MILRPHWMLVTVFAVAATGMSGAMASDYQAEIADFRAQQEKRLMADDGWLTVAGLFFLTEGEYRFGTGPLNDFVLPPGSAPDVVGVFEFHDGRTRVRAVAGGTVTVNGTPVASAELRPAGNGHRADEVTIGSLTLWVHLSGDRKVIRLRDQHSWVRAAFTGRRWFPVDDTYRVVAGFEPLPEPEPVDVPNILGDMEHYTASGFVSFELNGQPYRMKALQRRNGGLWFIFRDLTSGRETYPSARFLYTDPPAQGHVVLDFNKAVNPPCAFNPFTTCPLPLPENRLTVRIAAGELNYHATDPATAGQP